MIAALARFSVTRAKMVVALVLLVSAVSLGFALHLPLDALPDLTNNQVVVLTTAPGLGPEELELSVTRPVEIALSGLPNVEEQRSISRYGISQITLIFKDSVDPWRARQMVSERLSGLELAPGVRDPELAPLSGGLGEVFHLTLSSETRTLTELHELALLRVTPLLKSVPGIVEVNSWGGAERTLDVVVEPLLLVNRGLSLREVRDALVDATGFVPGGNLMNPEGLALLRGVARPVTPLELGSVMLARPSVRASDLGRAVEGTRLRLGAATSQGRGETVYLMAQMLRDENALEVLTRVHQRMPAVRAALPEDVRIRVVYDRSELVLNTLHTVGKSLLEGGVLVVLVLLAFLGSWRAGLVAASVIPLSMMFALGVMSILRLPGNLMSLGALDFGLLVDGAIVLVEGVFHHSRAAEGRMSFREHVREVAGHMARPVFFSVLVILLVYVPVLSMSGTDGKLFRPMAITVVLALSAALLLSMTYVPAALSLCMDFKHVPRRDPWLVRAIDYAYPKLLDALLPRRVFVLLCALGALSAGAFVASRSGVEFTPQLDEGDMVIQTTRRPDISLEQSIDAALHLERVLRTFPEVRGAVTRLGSPAVATDMMGFEQADVFVHLVPREQFRPGLTRDELVSEMAEKILREDPDSQPSFTQPIQMRFNELLGGAVTDVAVSLYGDDLTELRRLADALARSFRDVKGAADVRVLAPPAVPLVSVHPRPLDLAQVGLRSRDVLDAVQALRVGIDVGETRDGPLRIPLRLLLRTSGRAIDLDHLPMPLSGGGSVALHRVADVVRDDAPGLVSRRNGQRRLVIGFNVRGGDLATVVQAAEAKAQADVPLPAGYRLEWGGQYENLQQATARLALIVPAVLLLILGILWLTFGSVRTSLSVFTVVPLAVVGGLLMLALREMPISLPAAVGFIALSGIAVMNGVVWMARALELEQLGGEAMAIARQAACERVRPVLMTALVAALGFVPMMLAHGVGAELQRPLATVVVGGLVTSTLLTLIVLPVLYPWLRGRGKPASEPEGERR